jgi:hypothetical protein
MHQTYGLLGINHQEGYRNIGQVVDVKLMGHHSIMPLNATAMRDLQNTVST